MAKMIQAFEKLTKTKLKNNPNIKNPNSYLIKTHPPLIYIISCYNYILHVPFITNK